MTEPETPPPPPPKLVFISWSGDLAKEIALALSDLVENVNQSADCWVSDRDLVAGQLFMPQIQSSLNAARVGLIVLTPGNYKAPWVLFEAGALARGMAENGLTIPVLVKLSNTDLTGSPMQGIQNASSLGREDIFKALRSINDWSVRSLSEGRLTETFNMYFPIFEDRANQIIAKYEKIEGEASPAARDVPDVLEDLVRSVQSLNARFDFTQVADNGPWKKMVLLLVHRVIVDAASAEGLTYLRGSVSSITPDNEILASAEIAMPGTAFDDPKFKQAFERFVTRMAADPLIRLQALPREVYGITSQVYVDDSQMTLADRLVQEQIFSNPIPDDEGPERP